MKPTVIALAVAALIATACDDTTGPAPGDLTIAATGVPTGVDAVVVVRGPGPFLDSTTAGNVLPGLAAGRYTITARPVLASEDLYAAAQPTVTLDVGGDQGSVQAAFAYALASGRLAVTFTGVPGGFAAPAVITGPNRYVVALPTDMTVTAIPAGEYLLTTTPIDSSGHTFAAGSTSRPVSVVPSTTAAPLPVTYGLASARTALTISGLPTGAPASVTVTGPDGYQTLVTATDTLIQLAPGTYSVQPNDVMANGHTFAAPSYAVNLSPGRTPVDAAVTYVQTTGSMVVSITGLPPNNPSAVSVEGPDTTRIVAYSDTLIGIAAGTYTVRAPTLNTGGVEFVPADSVQVLSVAAATTSQVDVDYVFSGNATLNLVVVNAYIVQAIQRPDGSVPLVANRDGYLRVFVEASETNAMQPDVRARFFQNGILTDSVTIPAARSSVATKSTESSLGGSWNVLLPGSLLVANGLSMQIELDPDHLVPESDDTDNFFPADGQPLPLDVRSLGTFPMRLVPVIHGANQGDVSTANLDSYLLLMRRMYPMAADQIDVRAPFTSSAGIVDPDDNNNAWSNTLSEIRTLRLADQSPGYYYGVIHADYTSGIAGLGYVPSTPNSDFVAAVGWDRFPSAPSVLTHELGHNFGRRHAPCGNPSGPDLAFPHPNAQIGFYGIDLVSGALKVPQQPDIMSYCNNAWVSDYTYEGILARREASTNGAPVAAPLAATRSLLVWGRIRDDALVLEPAFEITGRPYLPPAPGPYRLQATGSRGETMFDLSFDGVEVADLPGPPERHFAFVVPVSGPVTTLRLAGGGRETVRTAPDPANLPPFVPSDDVSAVDAQRIQLDWDVRRHPMVMVRDGRTGDVLGFARGGSAVIRADGADLQLVYSTGVGGPTTVQRVPGRQ